MKKMPEKLWWLAFESILLVHEEGSLISKAPKNDTPNTMNNTNTKILNIALVEILYRVSFPKIRVSTKAKMVNIPTMEIEYIVAFLIPCALDWLRFKKKVTVTGNIAYKHGCSTEKKPQLSPSRKVWVKVLAGAGTIWASACWPKRNKTAHMKNVKKILKIFIT